MQSNLLFDWNNIREAESCKGLSNELQANAMHCGVRELDRTRGITLPGKEEKRASPSEGGTAVHTSHPFLS